MGQLGGISPGGSPPKSPPKRSWRFWGGEKEADRPLGVPSRLSPELQGPGSGGRPSPLKWGTLTVMAAPGGVGQDRRAGLSGAGIPPPPPPLPPPPKSQPPLRPFPSLPRRCPGPFHPPIKLFFFFKLPGRTPAGQWAARTPRGMVTWDAHRPIGARAQPRGRGLAEARAEPGRAMGVAYEGAWSVLNWTCGRAGRRGPLARAGSRKGPACR